ncbi:MAG: hypothetical protein JNM01_12220 [Delftia acidovorans]|nr:hypothetical protein [Delftia acidovorans]
MSIRFIVRDLHARYPDDYVEPIFDLLAEEDGKPARYSPDTYDTRAEAEADAIKWANQPLGDAWEVTKHP